MAGMRITGPIIAAAALVLAVPAAAQSYRGDAIAAGGDTLIVSAMGHRDVTLRVFGIEAPSLDSPDGDGWFARAALDDILEAGGGTVTCQQVGETEGGPLVHCLVDDGRQRDVGLAMIAAGWAVAQRSYLRANAGSMPGDLATAYVQAERAARRARKGRWARMPAK